METYKKIEATIKKYPEYFPWETKYNSISTEVHKKYQEEASKLYDEFHVKSGEGIKQGEGLVSYIHRMQEIAEKQPKKNLIDVIKEIGQREMKYKTAKKKLWGSHYQKFGLKCPF
ncbi:hypothetical protein [Flavobacterium sp.]|uniref:hypothetical protein n=1 Tax=Flavobacterium sp. TaxID=239 RepID=UPI003D6A56EC